MVRDAFASHGGVAAIGPPEDDGTMALRLPGEAVQQLLAELRLNATALSGPGAKGGQQDGAIATTAPALAEAPSGASSAPFVKTAARQDATAAQSSTTLEGGALAAWKGAATQPPLVSAAAFAWSRRRDPGDSNGIMSNPFASGGAEPEAEQAPKAESEKASKAEFEIEEEVTPSDSGWSRLKNEECTFRSDTDYTGEDLEVQEQSSPERCCHRCSEYNAHRNGPHEAKCAVAVLSSAMDDPPRACWLKVSLGGSKSKRGVMAFLPASSTSKPT